MFRRDIHIDGTFNSHTITCDMMSSLAAAGWLAIMGTPSHVHGTNAAHANAGHVLHGRLRCYVQFAALAASGLAHAQNATPRPPTANANPPPPPAASCT